MRWVLDRLQEGNTWRGLIWLLTAAGIAVSPELAEKIAVAGMALAGLLGVVMKEQANKVETVLSSVTQANDVLDELVASADPAAGGVSDVAVPPVSGPEMDAQSRSGSGWNG